MHSDLTATRDAAPALVVRPRDEAGVARAVRRAAAERLVLSVRSGGHSVAGHSTNDGGMVIDLARLDGVEVLDAERRLVRIGGGATWGPVSEALAPHGLGLTAGDTTSVGVGGLTLGGGVGWMVRRHGLAVDNLVGARVVTADGSILDVGPDRHPDLFWALRGGGGNFGVVVGFDFVAQPVTTVHFGSFTLRPDDPAGLVRRWRDRMRHAPDELTSVLTLVPPMFGGPASAVLQLCFSGADATAADVAIEPLLEIGTVTEGGLAATPYASILEDAHHPPGVRVIARNALFPDLHDAAVAAVVRAHAAGMALSLRSLGGAFGRVPSSATAFAHRDAEAMVIGGTFVPEDAPESRVQEVLTPWRSVAALGAGTYVNFQGSATEADVAAAYPPATYARLAAVKRAYDPTNLFRRNHNIAPGDAAEQGPAA